MSPEHEIIETDFGRQLRVISGGWQPEYAALCEEQGLTAFSITTPEPDLSFLEELPPTLRMLALQLATPTSLAVVERFRFLEDLSLSFASRRRLDVDFASFPNLRHALLDWNAGFESLFESPPQTLRELYLASQPHETLHPYRAFERLESLRFGQGARLRGTAGLPTWVKKLDLYYQRNLVDLAGAANLEIFWLQACKGIDTLDSLEPSTVTRAFSVDDCGDIASLAPIERMPNLESFFATDSTKVLDADLAPVAALNQLRKFGMQSRRAYTPSVEDIQTTVGARVETEGRTAY